MSEFATTLLVGLIFSMLLHLVKRDVASRDWRETDIVATDVPGDRSGECGSLTRLHSLL